MSKTDRPGDAYLSADQHDWIPDTHQRRLAFFRRHGIWINDEAIEADLKTGGGGENAKEVSRERALARGWSNEEIEQAYGPWVDKSKVALANKK
jgi:hypothetical protein